MSIELQKTETASKLVECTKPQLDAFPITNGCIYFCSDTGEILKDENGVRNVYSGSLTEAEKAQIEQNKNDILLSNQKFSNSLIETKIGNPVVFYDVSPIEHIISCYISGKNLANNNIIHLYADAGGRVVFNADMYSVIIPYDYNNDYTITNIDGKFMRVGYCEEIPIKGSKLIEGKYGFVEYLVAGENHLNKNKDYLKNAKYILLTYCRKSQSTNTPEQCYNVLQVEKGNTATSYESWINPTEVTITKSNIDGLFSETYKPNIHGFVENMYSLSPNMKVVASNPKVNIEISCNLDINLLNKKDEKDKNINPIKKLNGIVLVNTTEEKFTLQNSDYWNTWCYELTEGAEYTINTPVSYLGSKAVMFSMLNIPISEVELKKDITNNMINHSPIINSIIDERYISYSFKATKDMRTLLVTSTKKIICNNEKPIIDVDSNVVEIPNLSYNTLVKNPDKCIIAENFIKYGKGQEDAYSIHLELKRPKNERKNIILTILSKSEFTTKAPQIYSKYDNVYMSTHYALDNKEYQIHEFRFPAFKDVNSSFTLWLKVFPDSYVYIKDVNISYSNMRVPYKNGVRLSSHLGFYYLAPENTMPAFQASVDAGYPSIICNPKITSDGVCVCCHDTDIRRTARNVDGSEILSPIDIRTTTYKDLLNYDFGVAFNEKYKGTKIPTMEEFFKLCAKANVEPIWSTHYAFTPEQFRELKFMLKKYNLLHSFTMKGGLGVIEAGYDVFGEDIKGYVYDVGENKPDEYIQALKSSKLANSKTDIVIEFAKGSNFTEETCKKVIDAGYRMGVFDVFSTDGAEYNKWISWGITEIVDDANCSFGLNW